MINVLNKKYLGFILVIIVVIISIMITKTKENITINSVTDLLGINSSNELVSKNTSDINFSKIDEKIIFMWSGNVDNIPTGWYLCDGNNSTPDLRGRFIVGASTDNVGKTQIKDPNNQNVYRINSTNQLLYDVGNKGGYNFQVLSEEQMPKHNHGALDNNGSALFHPQSGGLSMFPILNGDHPIPKGGLMANVSTPYYADTSTGIQEIQNTGNTKPFENRPRYYTLAYIMYVGDNNT
jgi:microcystin-dependent protein